MEELVYRVLAEKGAFHEFVNSSCTSGKKGTGEERDGVSHSDPKNQSSSQALGTGWRSPLQPNARSCPGKHRFGICLRLMLEPQASLQPLKAQAHPLMLQ